MASEWSWDPETVRQRFSSSTASQPSATMSAPAPASAPAGDKENVPPAGQEPQATKTSRKRKSDAVVESKPEDLPEIDDEDPRLETPDQSCQQVRAKVRRFLDSGAMKVGEFQSAINVGSVQYYRFMNQKGTDVGSGSIMYYNAWKFFKKRELQGLKGTAPKKAKTTATTTTTKAGGRASDAPDALNVDGVTLDGEDEGKVPVYDTCGETRKKIRAILKKDGVTQAAFLRAIANSFPGDRKIQSKQLNDFLGKKDVMDGNTSCVFYGSYVFFEKLRIKQDKPKTEMRTEMEKLYKSSGVDIVEPSHRPIFLHVSETAYRDEYGQLHVVSGGGRDRVMH